MNRYACQYAIIRFLPYAETGEFANVGVVLACPATGYLEARLMLPRRTARITGFFEKLDRRIYREAMDYLKEELTRVGKLVADRGHGNPTFAQQAFAGLVRPREALLRFSETRVILAEQPADTLHKLFATMVERDFADKAYHDQWLERGVRETLRKAKLRDYFQPGDIGNQDLHIHVPFLHQREGRPQLAIKPLDLAKDEPNLVYGIGARWVGQMRLLQRHQLLPESLLFAVSMPDAKHERVHAAVEEILNDLRGTAAVQAVPITDVAAITTFANAATTVY
ncbi:MULTISPECIES: DUF3037 domain-containing protein [Rhodanobacter]|uniref:DUF3037 domain-containing protein n=1 Tax=Rhodanobacter TaxID=75309 RepID=UPI000405BFFD|nr:MULTISPECIES: DUF3037 domain-containing protein [Rhodanobacter]UJJ55055.1 DUF3037 domain-containing protein [Rhodanobacter thiooxydans]